jgi:O-acetyl-ADP-ribose deacetylase (regulator of RNase III)
MTEARLEIFAGDITTLEVDAIVNAANEALAPGGGVCGAIHRAAGPQLAAACARIGPCPTGEARLTEGYELPARYVIHAVGPVWHGGERGEPDLLAGCYRHAIQLATEQGLESIAFPAISTGIFGYPLSDATAVAVAAVSEALAAAPTLQRVIFCTFGDDVTAAYEQALAN